jgi:hypothetical protein
MRSDPQALGVLLIGEALHTAQQNLVIAAMRRPHSWLVNEGGRLKRTTFPARPASCIQHCDDELASRNPAARSGQGPSDLATVWKEDHRME